MRGFFLFFLLLLAISCQKSPVRLQSEGWNSLHYSGKIVRTQQTGEHFLLFLQDKKGLKTIRLFPLSPDFSRTFSRFSISNASVEYQTKPDPRGPIRFIRIIRKNKTLTLVQGAHSGSTVVPNWFLLPEQNAQQPSLWLKNQLNSNKIKISNGTVVLLPSTPPVFFYLFGSQHKPATQYADSPQWNIDFAVWKK